MHHATQERRGRLITTPWGDGDSKLSEMYTPVSLLPYAGSVNLDGGFDFQAQMGMRYVVVLTGFKSSPGRYPVSLSITSP